MENEINKFPRKKNDYGDSLKMTPKEKQISFYNNYFIYKKIRNVDTVSVYNTMVGTSKFQEQMKALEEEDFEKDLEKDIEKDKAQDKEAKKNKAPKKLKRKLKLVQVSKESVEGDSSK